MLKMVKTLVAVGALSLMTACGGGGGGGGGSAQVNSDDAAAALAQKIRNGAAAVGAVTIVNTANN